MPEGSAAEMTSRIHQGPLLKTQEHSVGTKQGRYICPIFSTCFLRQGGVDSSIEWPMRAFQFDLNEVTYCMKRRKNLPRTVHFLSWMKHVESRETLQNFLSEIFLSQSCLRFGKLWQLRKVYGNFQSNGETENYTTYQVKWGKSFIRLVYAANRWKRKDPNIR